jgi:hypothetical protein
VSDAVDLEWLIAAAFQFKTAADALWLRVQRFYAELLRIDGLAPADNEAFDREYFRQKVAEARERRRRERAQRIAETLADRSGPLMLDEPVRLEAVPGLEEALNGLVNSPIPVELLRAFLRGGDFDLDGYQRHVLSHLGLVATDFEAIPGLIDDRRKDRIFRFIAMVFVASAGKVEIWQEGEQIRVRKRETYEQGQGVPGRVAEAA